jgi:hypothetical protein
MDTYSGHHEIRFKITDQEAKPNQDIANYFLLLKAHLAETQHTRVG